MITTVKVTIFAFFVCFCLGLLYRAMVLTWRRRLEEKSKRTMRELLENQAKVTKQTYYPLERKPLETHVHNWRQITEFIKQCRECKEFEVAADAPLGLYDFIMKQQRLSGAFICPDCNREIPALKDLPQSPFSAREIKCPYCGFDLEHWNY